MNNVRTKQDKIKRNVVFVNANPENDTLNRNTSNTVAKRIVPGNESYSNMTRHTEKLCIIGDSISKRIDMVKFNKEIDKGTTIKRCFPGAIASQFKSYIKPTIKDDEPDIVILSFGTNNLSKRNKKQTDMEIAGEIIDVVQKCRKLGVNEVYVIWYNLSTTVPSAHREN